MKTKKKKYKFNTNKMFVRHFGWDFLFFDLLERLRIDRFTFYRKSFNSRERRRKVFDNRVYDVHFLNKPRKAVSECSVEQTKIF